MRHNLATNRAGGKDMGIDRVRLEQEALKLLQRGKIDSAIERYQSLLRDDPRVKIR